MQISKYFLKLLSTTLLLFPMASAAAYAQSGKTIWMEAPTEGVNLGQGFDLLTGEPTAASCVDFIVEKEEGTETFLEVKELNSYVNTLSSLDISGSGKLKMALLTASVKADFANSAEITSNDKKFSVNARIENGSIYAAPTIDPTRSFAEGEASSTKVENSGASAIRFSGWVFDNSADATAAVLGPTEIAATTLCGHGYVSAIVTGAKLNAVVDHSFDDSVEEATFSGEAKAKFLFFELEAQVDGSSTAKAKTENSAVKAYLLGGGEETKLPQDIDALRAFVKDELPKIAANDARPIRIAITPYERLYPKLAGVFKTPDQINVLLEAFFLTKEAAARMHYSLAKVRSTSQDLADNKRLFRPFSEEELLILLDDAYEQMDVLRFLIANEYQSGLASNAATSAIVNDVKISSDVTDSSIDEGNKNTVFGGFSRAISDVEATESARQQKKRDGAENDDGGFALMVSNLSKNAELLYLSALLAIPFDVEKEAQLDGYIELDALRIAVEKINKKSSIPTIEDDLLKALQAAIAEAEKKKSQCIAAIPEFTFNFNDFPYGEPPAHILERYGERDPEKVSACQRAFEASVAEAKNITISSSSDEVTAIANEITGNALSNDTDIAVNLIVRFVSKQTYRNELETILRSSCSTGSKSLVCKLGYKNLKLILSNHILRSVTFVNDFNAAVANVPAPKVNTTPVSLSKTSASIPSIKSTICSGRNHGGFPSFQSCWDNTVEP